MNQIQNQPTTSSILPEKTFREKLKKTLTHNSHTGYDFVGLPINNEQYQLDGVLYSAKSLIKNQKSQFNSNEVSFQEQHEYPIKTGTQTDSGKIAEQNKIQNRKKSETNGIDNRKKILKFKFGSLHEKIKVQENNQLTWADLDHHSYSKYVKDKGDEEVKRKTENFRKFLENDDQNGLNNLENSEPRFSKNRVQNKAGITEPTEVQIKSNRNYNHGDKKKDERSTKINQNFIKVEKDKIGGGIHDFYNNPNNYFSRIEELREDKLTTKSITENSIKQGSHQDNAETY